MTEQPTFEYRDEDGDDLIARPMRGIPAVLILTGTNGIAVDLDRVEEVVAGIRDAARTAAGRPAGPLTHAAAADAAAWAIAHEKAAARQTTGQDDTWPLATPCGYCAHTLNWHVTGGRCRLTAGENRCGCTAFVAPDGSHPDTAGQPDPTTADNPTPLRWGLGDILHGDDDTTTVCLSGLDREPYWLELDPERAAAFRRDLTPPAAEDTIGLCGYCGVPRENHHHGYTSTADVIAASPYSRTDDEPAPAVGQPAEAHDTDRAELRERLRLAIAQQYLDDTGSGRTVDELDDTEFGSLADAALSVLTVEGER